MLTKQNTTGNNRQRISQTERLRRKCPKEGTRREAMAKQETACTTGAKATESSASKEQWQKQKLIEKPRGTDLGGRRVATNKTNCKQQSEKAQSFLLDQKEL